MTMFAKSVSAVAKSYCGLATKVQSFEIVWRTNRERWLTNIAVFSVLALALVFFLIGVPGSANAQGANVADTVASYFSPSKQTFSDVYRQNFESLSRFGCWGCNVFDAFSRSIFDAGERVGGSGPGRTFSGVIVAFACCFSLYYVGSAFVSGDASDLLARWKGFWRLMLSVAVASAFLTTGGGSFENTWRMIYGPILSVPLAVAQEVNNGAGASKCPASPTAPSRSAELDGASKSLDAMRGVVCDSNEIAIKGIAFGTAMAMSGDGFVGAIVNAACGLIVMAIFFYITITFPMRFIDVLIRLSVVSVLTPVFIVCATFKPTRGYVQIAISNILYCGSVFAFTSILFGLGIKFIENRMDAHINAMKDSSTITIIGSGFEIVAMAMIFASFSRTAVSLAQEFSQFRGSAGHAGDTAINLTNTVASTAIKGASAGTSLGAHKVASSMRGQPATGSGTEAHAGTVGGGSASGTLGRGVSS